MKRLLVLCSVLLILSTACGGASSSGAGSSADLSPVETGNPPIGDPSQNSPSTRGTGDPAVASSYVMDFSMAVCNKLFVTCEDNAAAFNVCAREFSEAHGFDVAFGLNDGGSRTFDEVIGEIFNEMISVNMRAAEECRVDLENLDCSADAIQEVLADTTTTALGDVASILPQRRGSCPQVLR